MICTGKSCTICDTLVDIRVYQATPGSGFTTYRTQGLMHGTVEMVAVGFPDSLSLAQAGEIMSRRLGRRPIVSDSLHLEWSDGASKVRMVKGRGRPVGMVISVIPPPSTGPGCPVR